MSKALFQIDRTKQYDSPAERLRAQIADPKMLTVSLGVFDGISGRTAVETNPPALYMSGAATAASRCGQPDLGIATQDIFVSTLAMLVSIAGDIPIIADMDTGFGSVLNIKRSVEMYEQVGAAAFHIEDQVMPKRCGHLGGKEVVSHEEWRQRLQAALAARSKKPSAPLIIARTDAVHVTGIEDAIERIKIARDTGVDVGFVEGVRSKEECEKVIKELAPFPMVLNLPTNGVTPNFTNKEAHEMGFRITWHPIAGAVAAVHAMRQTYADVMEKGTDVESARGMGPRGLFEAQSHLKSTSRAVDCMHRHDLHHS